MGHSILRLFWQVAMTVSFIVFNDTNASAKCIYCLLPNIMDFFQVFNWDISKLDTLESTITIRRLLENDE